MQGELASLKLSSYLGL